MTPTGEVPGPARPDFVMLVDDERAGIAQALEAVGRCVPMAKRGPVACDFTTGR
jgi:hypothetical protein